MTAILECRGLKKHYGAATTLGAQRGIDLGVERGEVIAIIGPSGCGKTTLLRIIGGFIEPSEGTVLIEGEDVTREPPYRRPTNMVFQNYALFPHLTVLKNVTFGLEMEGVAKAERKERALQAIAAVGLGGFEQRYVGELSGGQMQRAALARVLVKRPSVVLLDEPLGALDLKLRRQMQDEIVRLKNELRMTIIHVTHDQEEACAVADRIAVMKGGQIVQIATPQELFRRPSTAYVAEFLSAATVVRGKVLYDGSEWTLESAAITLKGSREGPELQGTAVGLLPRRGMLIERGELGTACGPNATVGMVSRLAFGGIEYAAQVELSDSLIVPIQLSIEQVDIMNIAVGSTLKLSWPRDGIRLVPDDVTP